MSVRSFHSVFMATAVAGAALGCYLVSLRVASERAALDSVETQIALTQRDIRLIQTEIGTRARLAQLERWNVRALSLSAPTADQILGDKFQLARLIAPERKPPMNAPVILATAPAPDQPLSREAEAEPAQPASGRLMHEASVKLPEATLAKPGKPEPAPPPPAPAKAQSGEKGSDGKAKAGKKPDAAASRPVRTASADPLAPLPAGEPTTKGSRPDR